MSPEQAQGDLEHFGPHSDVYSLGATLYCLLSGKPPVEGDDVGHMLRAVQKGEFPRPRQFDPTIDRSLEAVCLKAMSRKPEDRYASPRALAADLERWMADEPVDAWREPVSRRAQRWARRHRTGVTTSAAVLLMALAGTAAVSAVQTRANSQLKTANAALGAANEREAARFNLAIEAIKLFHGEISEDLLLKEKQFDRLRSRLLRGAAEFYGKLEELLKGQADRRSRSALGKAYHELGELTNQIGSKAEALVVHDKALAVRRDLAADPRANAETKADVARSLLAVGTLLQETARLDEAVHVFERARSLSEGLAEHNPRSDSIRSLLAYCYYRIGRAAYLSRESTEALTAYERAQTIFQKLTEANPANLDYLRGLSWCYNDIGIELEAIGRLNDSLVAYERSVAVKQRVADANPDVAEFRRDLALGHMNIGFLLMVSGKSSEALAVHEQARAIQEKLAEANPNVTLILAQLAKNLERIGSLLVQTGKPGEALASQEKSLAIRRRLAEANPSVTDLQLDLAQSLARVGRLKQQAGRAAEAAALFEQFRQTVAALEQLPTLYPVDLYNLACSHAILASVAAEPGSGLTTDERQTEADRAIQWLRRAIAAGYRKVNLIQTDPDLEPLRSRPDFRLLMMDLEFPDDPFSRED
jgi:tetratricopeptide (TPR) repeat protein